jgi:hypothetical protein
LIAAPVGLYNSNALSFPVPSTYSEIKISVQFCENTATEENKLKTSTVFFIGIIFKVKRKYFFVENEMNDTIVGKKDLFS